MHAQQEDLHAIDLIIILEIIALRRRMSLERELNIQIFEVFISCKERSWVGQEERNREQALEMDKKFMSAERVTKCYLRLPH